ncbi:hypothetical protein NEI02_01325 [Brachyspira pilosicoli]|uniref:Lipoprotein n=1 Tax=Brachyspira pilosicoli TaxID=52584 RepID=A0AAJ6GE04_BRAPL|nr:hypothetical protein [Brachyspira pilosicoli]WIH90611.1 hypothetical protein NEI02_01325 [Brachyspira pilosicoli]WIH92902.1 hypothetical protein NEI01_01325 [Brachyspira pilosicoli]WIH95191.1 hypothetical protein NEH99_01320 [Brachyspira pilosicoli]
MKKFLLIISIISMAAISCADKNGAGTEVMDITKNVPSADKTVKEGISAQEWLNQRPNAQVSASVQATQLEQNAATGTYDLLQRLYSTTWYQTEMDYDDGREETETTFILFNQDSSRLERELETGERPEEEYISMKLVKTVTTTTGVANEDMNACVVQTQEQGDREVEYEGYYLRDRDTLYVVDGDTADSVEKRLNEIIANPDSYQKDKEKYTLYLIRK